MYLKIEVLRNVINPNIKFNKNAWSSSFEHFVTIMIHVTLKMIKYTTKYIDNIDIKHLVY